MRSYSIFTVLAIVSAVFAAPIPDVELGSRTDVIGSNIEEVLPVVARMAEPAPESIPEPFDIRNAEPELVPEAEVEERRGCGRNCQRDAVPEPEPLPEPVAEPEPEDEEKRGCGRNCQRGAVERLD